MSSPSSLFKKSFTLIELSIVLLILSLLVGSLLVGRQIVDRAKIQRIIFEFDYYEKAFHQFYDTYRVVPGNIDLKTCQKYADMRNNIACSSHVLTKSAPNSKVLKGDLSAFSVHNCFNYMRLVGLIENEKGMYGGSTSDNDDNPLHLTKAKFREVFIRGNRSEGTLHFFPWSSYDHEAYIQPMGFHVNRWEEFGGIRNFSNYMYCGSNTYLNKTLPHEFDNKIFQQSIHDKNVFTILRGDKNMGEYTTQGTLVAPKTSAMSAKMTSELDAKIDDGRPGTGSILAMKGGTAHDRNTTEDQHIAVCYDKRADQVDKAIYHSNTNLKFGCNVMYVLEGLK